MATADVGTRLLLWQYDFVTTECSVACLMAHLKLMDFWPGQGANHSDTQWYREDLQRCHGRKDAVLSAG
jgi:hypothetical protein